MNTTDPARSDSSPRASEGDLRGIISATLRRWPSAGVAVAVVRDGSTVRYFCHGVADIASGRRVSEGTVFRVGSLTKTVTAVAVMQLCEQGIVDLDAPANDYLRGFQLVPANAGFGPATVRHLLTHTAGVGFWRRRSDLLHHPGVGSGVTARAVTGLWDAMVLHPDDPDDPRVYRVESPRYDKTWRVVFTEDTPPRLLLDVLSFQRRPGWRNPRRWSTAVLAAGVAGAVVLRRGKG
jgi:hypothetical protein